MENKIREPYNPDKKDYKTIKEIETIIDKTEVRLSDEKVKTEIENFQNSENLINYPNLDEFSDEVEMGRSK